MTDARSETMPGRRYDAALHLLDRQMVDPDGQLVANVDDLELVERDDGRLAVAAILVGPGALGPRFRGRLGVWIVGVWRRLHPATDPEPARVPMSDVVEVDSAVRLGRLRHELGVDALEDWVRDKVISRLPGARHDPE